MIMKNQQGMASVMAVMAFAVLFSLTSAIYLFSHAEQQTQQRFLLGWRVKRKAQDGLQKAQMLLNRQEGLADNILKSGSEVSQIDSYSEANGVSGKIHARVQNGKILVLSVASCQGIARRAVARLEKTGGEQYEFTSIEK